jgi:hypothetical protein
MPDNNDMTCVLCGGQCEPWHVGATGFGHNPEPLASYEDGRCCDYCNGSKVIPARMERILGRQTDV